MSEAGPLSVPVASVDPQTRDVYVYLPGHPGLHAAACVARSVQICPGVVVDYGHDGALIGVEVLRDRSGEGARQTP